jgi:uncharacterized membrane protein YkoI
MRNLFGVVAAALILTQGAATAAVADEDHERAREALQAGEIRPLKEIVESVQHRCGGKVIEVELDQNPGNGRRLWLYQLHMLMPTGNVLRLDVDAATTQILEVEGQGICQ